MKEAERAAIIATLGAVQEKLEAVAAEVLRITGPHQVIRSDLDGSAYFNVQAAADLFSLAERVEDEVASAVRSVEG